MYVLAEQFKTWVESTGPPAREQGLISCHIPGVTISLIDRSVTRDGVVVEFGNKTVAWKLFFELASRPEGSPRADLLKQIWPEKTVEESNLDHRKREVNEILERMRLEIAADNHGVWRLVALQ